jgi:hypothetical protein
MPLRRGLGLPKSVESGNLSVNKAVIRCRQNCVVREKVGDFHKRKVAHMAATTLLLRLARTRPTRKERARKWNIEEKLTATRGKHLCSPQHREYYL